jgi:hypothetical protein
MTDHTSSPTEHSFRRRFVFASVCRSLSICAMFELFTYVTAAKFSTM